MTVQINETSGRILLMPGISSGNLGKRSGVNIPFMRSTFLRGSSLTKVDTTIAARRSPCPQRRTRSEVCSCGHVVGLLHKKTLQLVFTFVINGMPIGPVLWCIYCFGSPT